MELNGNWVDIFRTALVCIEEFDDPVQAVTLAWQLYDTGEQFFSELEEEGTAIEIYKHCSYLLDLINKKGIIDPFLRAKCFFREKLLSSRPMDSTSVWIPFLFDLRFTLAHKLTLFRDISNIIDEYSDLEHINVWSCRLDLRISYENLLKLYSNDPSSNKLIKRELFTMFLRTGWKLLEKNFTKLACKMCQNIKRQFDELTESESLELLKLWADALEKDGNIELAIIKAQEANDWELVKRLNRVLEDLKSDSEPDAEWIRGTLAENNTKSQEQAKRRGKLPKKKRRSRRVLFRLKPSLQNHFFNFLAILAKWKDRDKHPDQCTGVHNAIADVTSHITNWEDVPKFDLPIDKPRGKQRPSQPKIPKDDGISQPKLVTLDCMKTAMNEDEFDALPFESPAGFSSGADSSTDDDSSVSEDFEQNSDENRDEITYYEESCKVYNDQGQFKNINDYLLTNGLDLSDKCVSGMTFPVKNIYDKMLSSDECLKLCKTDPLNYKLCKIEILNSHRAICRTIDDENMEIEISGRSKCGKVFNQDDVVVKLFHSQQKSLNLQKQSNEVDKIYGKVIGKISRNEKRPKTPVFVCSLDTFCMHHMKPLCKTVPKMHVLNRKRERESQVEIYKYTRQTKKLTFDRLKTIDQSKRQEYLFLVCFISWNGMYPLGAVIGVYDGNRDIKTSIRLVCLRNNVSVLYRENTVRETEKILSSQMLDQNDEQHRKDYSDSLSVFTIDGNDSRDLDDAFSVQIISQNETKVGVHISDVGSLIKKGDSIDVEAKERSTTYYPGGSCPPYHMLPEPLGTDLCSLLPDQKRKALSIFFRIDKYGKILEHRIERTFIKSRRRLTYCMAQELITEDDENSELKRELCLLRDISERFRSERLKNKVFSFPFEVPYDNSSESYFQCLDAHHIVEELMILVNKTIGQDLIETFPDCIPLRVQPEPSACKIQDWLQQYPVIGHFVLSLQQQRLPTNEKLSFKKNFDDQNSEQLPIQKYMWKKIESDFKMEDYKNVKRWIGTDQYHPQQAMAYESWISFQETSFYQCSGVSHDKIHFSLGIYPYLHFTSPIRRYADLIVNRLVHAMLDKKKSPYTRKEMEIICKKISSQSRTFEKQCRLLHLARQLQHQPIMLHSLVSSASDNAMVLCFPGIKELTKSSGQIQFSSLKLKSKPHFEESQDTEVLFTLSWIQRLYSPYAFGGYPLGTISRKNPVKIDPHQRVIFVSLQKWKSLLECMVDKNLKSLETDTFEEEILVQRRECTGTHLDVTSESNDGIIRKLQSEFSLTFQRGQVIPVQIGCEKKDGFLVPKIQMLELTNNVKCCIQHMSDPVKCFAFYASIHAGNRRMSSSEYIQRWLKIFRMESATNAAKSTSIIINDMHIKFQSAGKYDGTFILLKKFCFERDIYIDFTWNDEQTSEEKISYQTDFLCIRCEIVRDVPLKSSSVCPPNERWIWIGHAETKCFQRGKDNGDIKVHFKLHKDSHKPTASMMDTAAKDKLVCTVEILPMTDGDKHIEKALTELDKAPQLARSIALREDIPCLDENRRTLAVQTGFDVMYKDLQPNNEKQLKAIKQALTSRFTLIQGPPGTGKTLTGIKLIILFNRINLKHREEGGDHKQVVYCGPSNKSVDLVARWMKFKTHEICPKIVRMYGNSMENMIFPIPNREYINYSSCKDNRPDSELADISLHNLIRQKEKPYAEQLATFEKQFKNAPDEIVTDDIFEYKKVISKATQEELKKYDVIFCTTAAALSPKFLKATNGKIFQLIIDEAGMCTEPETLAPIIATKADQVVLIGDHKQLQPIILCPEASNLGLSKSLFERYADNAVFLDTQYRMNPKICEFPSTQFYKGKLKTGPIGKWTVEKPLQIWQRPDVPLLFCHIEGEEECLSVTTEEGNQQSRSNRAEVDHVVKVYDYLMTREKLQSRNVKVMSQYNAQCFAIRDALKKKRFINSNVTTAVSSQVGILSTAITICSPSAGGEWDYVIFSAVRSLPKFRIESNRNKGWCKKNLGFITDAHQINVVLTRARKGIIIIGNKNLLQCDETWEALIKHYTILGCVVNAEDQDLTPLERPGRRY